MCSTKSRTGITYFHKTELSNTPICCLDQLYNTKACLNRQDFDNNFAASQHEGSRLWSCSCKKYPVQLHFGSFSDSIESIDVKSQPVLKMIRLASIDHDISCILHKTWCFHELLTVKHSTPAFKLCRSIKPDLTTWDLVWWPGWFYIVKFTSGL